MGNFGTSFAVVSGDAIEGTITPRLLERQNPAISLHRLGEENKGGVRQLPTVDQFSDIIVRAAFEPLTTNGQTIFVGSTEY